MQSQNRLFDDFVKVMNGAAGTIAGMTREAQAAMQERAREWIGGLDLVSREEFEAVKAMAAAARRFRGGPGGLALERVEPRLQRFVLLAGGKRRSRPAV